MCFDEPWKTITWLLCFMVPIGFFWFILVPLPWIRKKLGM